MANNIFSGTWGRPAVRFKQSRSPFRMAKQIFRWLSKGQRGTIAESVRQAQSKATQQLISRGLYSTTIAPTTLSGIAVQGGRALAGLRQQAATTALGAAPSMMPPPTYGGYGVTPQLAMEYGRLAASQTRTRINMPQAIALRQSR